MPLHAWLGKAAVLGLGALAMQRLALNKHFAGPPPARRRARQGISILKPLCGVEPGLATNLAMFAALPYAPYELLLGVESQQDPAYALAQAVAKRAPHVKVVLREGEPGLNPKVNQLITLARHARFPIALISDANMRPAPGYLDEMSALFEDERVGLVTNLYSGRAHQTLGALFDNLHMATNSVQHLAGKELLGKDYVMGGSEALRVSVLRRLGGFERYKDVLAEDYLIGRDVGALGYKVATGRVPVFSTTPKRTVESFYKRFARWGQMQSTAMGSPLPAVGLGLFNPIALAGLAWWLAPAGIATKAAGAAFAGITAAKVALDISSARALGVAPLGFKEMLAVPAKDAVLFGSWLTGLVSREVDWRGKKFRVGSGTKLSRAEGRPRLGSALGEEPSAGWDRFKTRRLTAASRR